MAVTQLAGPSQPLHTSARQRRRIWLIAAVVVLVASVAPIWVLLHEHSGGDPGGRILGTLVGVRDAIPPGATRIDVTTKEAFWIGSCPDEYFHKGWGTIGVTIDFDSHLSQKKVFANVSDWMARNGWHTAKSASVGPTDLTWKRRLPQGVTATFFIQHDQGVADSQPWSMNATSPPIPPVGECAGG